MSEIARFESISGRLYVSFVPFQLLASASGAQGLTNSQICIWDLENNQCKKVLSHHEYDIVCLDYSRDDRFLISAGKLHVDLI
jgi:WD40 repeat protein